MPALPQTTALWSTHTFGRSHIEPPPLPMSMQQGQAQEVQQMGQSTSTSQQMYAGLPHDFDHIVRSVGEW